MASSFKTTQSQTPRRHQNQIHRLPLPLTVHPLPPFHPTQPLSLLHLIYTILKELWSRPTSHAVLHAGYISPVTTSVHITDPSSIRALWERGFFGKGSLSRSEPEWLERQKERARARWRQQHGGRGKETAAEVTGRRRKERRDLKRERARLEAEAVERQLELESRVDSPQNNGSSVTVGQPTHIPGLAKLREGFSSPQTPTRSSDQQLQRGISTNEEAANVTDIKDQEHLQLSAHETFFLSYALGVLKVYPQSAMSNSFSDEPIIPLSTQELLWHICRHTKFPALPTNVRPDPDNKFLVEYSVYHHYRSLGWVVRPGVKFGVDLLLYARGPVFAHAEFAVVILPSYTKWQKSRTSTTHSSWREHDVWKERGEWWWLHAANRVQGQVKKTLILVYVDVPTQDEMDMTFAKHDRAADVDIGALLKLYAVQEFVIKRWSANRNRK